MFKALLMWLFMIKNWNCCARNKPCALSQFSNVFKLIHALHSFNYLSRIFVNIFIHEAINFSSHWSNDTVKPCSIECSSEKVIIMQMQGNQQRWVRDSVRLQAPPALLVASQSPLNLFHRTYLSCVLSTSGPSRIYRDNNLLCPAVQ